MEEQENREEAVKLFKGLWDAIWNAPMRPKRDGKLEKRL